jgi:hypothetical protein
MRLPSNQPQTLKSMSKPILSHGICHEICYGLDFLAAVAHGHAHGTIFEHRNINLGVTKGNGILNPAANMFQQLINGMSKIYIASVKPRSYL